MKKYLSLLLILAFSVIAYAQDPAYPAVPAAPLNVMAAESFIDTDPGVGKGTTISIAAATDISNAAAVVNVTGLSNGIHRLYIRTRSNEGSWSITGTRDFLYDANPVYVAPPAAAQNIVAAEYFIDTDPGFGNGTAVVISAGLDLNNVTVAINTGGLTNSNHRLYLRTKNAEGRWSLVQVKDFIVDFDFQYPAAPAAVQNIIAAEYFFDTDPGFGKGALVTIVPGTDLNTVAASVNTAGLGLGTHRLYFRTKNQEGRWAISLVREFIVNNDFSYPAAPAAVQNVVAAEYFFDTDPGFGNGMQASITAGTDLNGIAAAVNTTGLGVGSHLLYVRTKNQEGRWAITLVKDFIVDNDFSYPTAPAAAQNVTAAEYFIDTDPGFGAASSIPVTPGTNISNLSVTVNTAGLTSGTHRLFVRTRSQEGRWSIAATDTFATSLMRLSADTLVFGDLPVNTTLVKSLVVTNNSAVNQTINAAVIHAPFSTNFSGVITLAPGQATTFPISFLPTAATGYIDSLVLATSTGSLKAVLTGTGITQIASWTLEPASGYNYGNVPVATTSNTSFTIRNTGNIDIVLSAVTVADPAFTAGFTAGTVIPANGSISLPVAFTPSAVSQYTAQLKIQSSTGGVSDVTTSVSGNGYTPGTPPVLSYVNPAPYGGTSGVNPAAGQPGLYTYKILYQSANNRAPQSNYPQVGIDLNGDGDFNDLDEGVFSMVKEGSSTDYITGVVYSYTFSHSNLNSTAGYQFFAKDDNGNAAGSSTYKTGPVITDQQLDLRIFANNISFSKNNPQPGETFAVTASISNSTAIPAVNVPVKFYRDTILIGSTVVPAVNAFSSSTASFTLNFAAEGFFPIKVWIDSSNTLGESNVLNNFAIRPVIVGSPQLPGGITATTSASVQTCPQQKVLITGNAVYFGTGNATMVAGAAVTINTGTQVINTTTDANGNYSFLIAGVTCGGNFTYTVSITDFTFTSSTVTNSFALPCPPANACTLPPSQGGVQAIAISNPCANLVGSSANVNFVLKYRESDVSNFWRAFDGIINDKLEVFQDGVLVQTYTSADYSHGPGNEVTIPVSFPLSSTAPVTITGRLSYTYVEYLQIPSSLYHGNLIPVVTTGGGTINPQPNQPDLTIQNFQQVGFTNFSFSDANIKCGAAGTHTVKVFDVTPGGSTVLLSTQSVGSLAGGQAITLGVSAPSMASGTHTLKIITDADAAVAEQDESNNEFDVTVVVPDADLSVPDVKANTTALSVGDKVQFTATVKNTGRAAGGFQVRFAVNGVTVGVDKTVTGISEKGTVKVVSDFFTVTTPDTDCGPVVTAVADINNTIVETTKANNTGSMTFAPDLAPLQLSGETGSAANPAIVRVNTTGQFFPAIRNVGERDADNVTVSYTLNGVKIGAESIGTVRVGGAFAAHGTFTHTFTATGDFVVKVKADTGALFCEPVANNEGDFHIRVVDSKADFEVLSQFISPSSLNPNAGQNITIVGTVRNTGGKPTAANVLRFLVDDIQLGADIPINALAPGRDTTVAATASYSSIIQGVKVMKIVADPANILAEEREDNNEATRALIVGDAPDMARSHAGAIRFNPGGFRTGDSVNISYSIRNNGVQDGSAWVRFLILDAGDALTAIDSVPFTLAAGAGLVVTHKMLFDTDRGTVIAQIVNCSPAEFDLLNNNDTLAFSTVGNLRSNTTVSGNLDMKAALPDNVPGWIGGKLLLGDYDLTVNGIITNFDTAHFVVTNGTGKLKFANSNAQNTFPVAASLDHPNFLQINNAGTPDNFTVAVVPYVLQNGSNGDTLKTGYVNRTWLIEEQVPGGSNAELTFSWTTADEQNGFDRMLSRTAHYTGSWQLAALGAAVTDSAAWFSRLQGGYSSFSPFTVTSVSAGLPLHLLQFTAAATDRGALLDWQTDNEVNTSHFVIQHSVNGLQFEDAGTVTAKNTGGVHTYSFTHGPLAAGLHYYRLRMVDADGKFTYSPVKMLKTAAVSGLQLYPNPAGQFVKVQGLEASGIIRIFTADGRLLKQWTATGSTLLADLSGMAGGMYIVTWSIHGKTVQRQLVKQ